MKKVKLRYYTEEDFDFLHEMLSDNATKKHFPNLYTTSKEQSLLRLKTILCDQEWECSNRRVIEDIETNQAVGQVSRKNSL